jgi:DNA-binding response OmpR family regulator
MIRLSRRRAPTAQFLLVHHEPDESRVIVENLRHKADAEVASARTVSEGARLIAARHFDLALIDAVLPDMAGMQLASLAANQNMPVLLLSENSSSSAHVRRLGYPYLEKPFDVEVLVAESIAIVRRARLIVRDVAISADRVEATMKALAAEVAEAHRLFDLIISRLGRNKG